MPTIGMELCTSEMVMYGGIDADQATEARRRMGIGMAYVWGRQDAGEDARDTGYSQTFATVYALAAVISGGYTSNLQSCYHQYHDTGRIVVRVPGYGRIVEVAARDEKGTTVVEARPVPWATDYPDSYYPGI